MWGCGSHIHGMLSQLERVISIARDKRNGGGGKVISYDLENQS